MSTLSLTDMIQSLRTYDTSSMAGSDFLLTWEKRDHEISAILDTAEILRVLHRQCISTKIVESGLAVSIFRDKSTRTRFSFAGAVNLLGLALQELDEEKSQIAHGETVRETAVMISFLTKVLGIRDDMYLGTGNAYMQEVAQAVDEGYRDGILHHRPIIVNLQCDLDHPTQTMADLAFLKNKFGSLENLRGKKLVMSWAYSPSYGKPLSVPQGIIGLMTRFGMDVSLAYPEGYELLPEVVQIARDNSDRSGGTFSIQHSMDEAFAGADVVYPKSWAPFQIMKDRTRLLACGDREGLRELEKTCLATNARFTHWECNNDLMSRTHGDAIYMHCLPADITDISCDHGEVSREIFDRYRKSTYKEASWKPFIIAAMLFLALIHNPADRLSELLHKQ